MSLFDRITEQQQKKPEDGEVLTEGRNRALRVTEDIEVRSVWSIRDVQYGLEDIAVAVGRMMDRKDRWPPKMHDDVRKKCEGVVAAVKAAAAEAKKVADEVDAYL